MPKKTEHLRLFNRWGKEVYSKNGYLDEWDGSGLTNGTYFYELEILGKYRYKGSVTVVR